VRNFARTTVPHLISHVLLILDDGSQQADLDRGHQQRRGLLMLAHFII
jgi:hypothetical protein